MPPKAPKKPTKSKPKPKSNDPQSFQYDRDLTCKFKFGAHVSTSGGVSNSILNARNIGANSFAMFLKSPRKWVSPDIKDDEANKFKQLCSDHGYNPRTDILPHGSYFINMGNPDPEKAEKAYGSFLDDLKRCEKLDIGLYNFHPGSSLGSDHKQSLIRLAGYINRAIKDTQFVKIVIENMAGHGDLIGSNLQDIRDVIDLVDDKSRVGVCIDTCHTFAAGYDISCKDSYDKFWQQYQDIIGWEYLSGIHLNDSKAPLGANRDLHQKLGFGFLGLEVFRIIADDERLHNVPIILETPVGDDDSVYGEEIKLLEWLQGKAHTDEEFIAKSTELSSKGSNERAEQLKKFQDKTKKAQKSESKSKSEPTKRKGTIDSMFSKKAKTE